MSELPVVEDEHVFTDLAINFFKVFYITVFAVGMFGNTITFTAMLLRQRLKRAVDIYTFNLAICDILILCLYVPTQILFIDSHLDWRMGVTMCRVVNAILPVTLACTIGCLLAITLDRTRSLAQPLKWRNDSVKPAKIIITVIWIISILVNIPLYVFPKLINYNGITICAEGWPDIHHGEIFWVVIFTLLYCVPLVVLVVAYLLMVVSIDKISLKDVHHLYHKKMVTMGIKLVFVFAICTGFQHYFFFITSSFSTVRLPTKTLVHLFAIANWFVSLQAAVNPYIYGNMRKIFKRAANNETTFWENLLDGYNNMKRRLTILSLINNHNSNNTEEGEKSLVDDDVICNGGERKKSKRSSIPGRRYIGSASAPCEGSTVNTRRRSIRSFPGAFEVEKYSVLQMIYYGLYMKESASEDLVSTVV